MSRPSEALYEILSNRGQLMDVDGELAAVLRRTMDGAATVEECFEILEKHQRAYDRYVRRIRESLEALTRDSSVG